MKKVKSGKVVLCTFLLLGLQAKTSRADDAAAGAGDLSASYSEPQPDPNPDPPQPVFRRNDAPDLAERAGPEPEAVAERPARPTKPGVPEPVALSESAQLGPNMTEAQMQAKIDAFEKQKAEISQHFGSGQVGYVREKFSVSPRLIQKAAGENLADLVVKKYKGCQAMNQACKDLILTMNRDLDAGSLDEALRPGTALDHISIPTLAWTGSAAIDVGNNFRIAKNGNDTTEYMSKSLAKALNRLPDPFFGSPDSVSFMGSVTYRTHRVFEDDANN